MLILLIAIYLIIILVDVPPLLREGRHKELLVFLVVLALGIVYSLGQYYQWLLPNPVHGIEWLMGLRS